jgi:hypothetical protein
MQDYIRYEIQERKYSSNVIVGVYQTTVNNKIVEKRDIIICPVLKKEDGDIHAELMLQHLQSEDILSLVGDLASVGFLCEIVTDAWANWEFKNGKPDYDSAKPMYENGRKDKDTYSVLWRGLFWYFDKETKKLMRDDTGLYETPKQAFLELIKIYTTLIKYIDVNGFNKDYNGKENN